MRRMIELALERLKAKTAEMNFKFDRGLISEEEWKEYMLSEDTLWGYIKETIPPLEISKFD